MANFRIRSGAGETTRGEAHGGGGATEPSQMVDLSVDQKLVVNVGGEIIELDGGTLLVEVKSTRSRDGGPRDTGPIEFYELVQSAARELLEQRMPSDARDYYASIGPWVTGNAVKETFGVSWQSLKTWRDRHALLGVEFADGKFYYPAKQFKDGAVVKGLPDVLAALAPGFSAPASRAGWLARPAYVGESVTRWDVLREHGPELLVEWAREDSNRVTAA